MAARRPLVPYDPQWPKLFAAEKTRIVKALGSRIVGVEHIGSTAVPGLGGRATVDIMVGVRTIREFRDLLGPLEALGYAYASEYEAFEPERRYFEKGPVGRRTHEMHVVEMDSDFWKDRLLFREYLRARPEEARRFFQIKLAMGERVGFDKLRYADAKDEFIRSAVARERKGLP